MSSTQVLNEAMKKINFNNLHETIFTYDPNEEPDPEAARRRALDANKVGHLAPDAPKLPTVGLSLQRVFNKNALREAKRSRRAAATDADGYTYADSQRRERLTKTARRRKLPSYEAAVDQRATIFNQLTSRGAELVTASVTAARPGKADLLAKISEITSRIAIMQAEALRDVLHEQPTAAEAAAAEKSETAVVEFKPTAFDLAMAIQQLVEAKITYEPDVDRVDCNIVLPLHLLGTKSERLTRRILNKAVEDFKVALIEIVLNPEEEHATKTVRQPAVSRSTDSGRGSSLKVERPNLMFCTFYAVEGGAELMSFFFIV